MMNGKKEGKKPSFLPNKCLLNDIEKCVKKCTFCFEKMYFLF
jgi:hypothetical protein